MSDLGFIVLLALFGGAPFVAFGAVILFNALDDWSKGP
jgi:hypothetical protein